jgi:cytochrome b subunit of formate dehydrogenase
MLVFTGMPLRYPYAVITKVLLFLEGGMAGRALLHRMAAVVLMGLCVYHLFYVLFSRRGHEDFLQMIPGRKDLGDFINTIKYYFGLSREPSKYGRFSYVEKFEYMAVAWGSVVMAATGLMLWFENTAMMILPKWALDIARVVHSYEALLAFLAIIIWHFYNVHLNPSAFPMSRIWLNGKISEEEMLRDHPLEYEEIMRERQGEYAEVEADGPPGPVDG